MRYDRKLIIASNCIALHGHFYAKVNEIHRFNLGGYRDYDLQLTIIAGALFFGQIQINKHTINWIYHLNLHRHLPAIVVRTYKLHNTAYVVRNTYNEQWTRTNIKSKIIIIGMHILICSCTLLFGSILAFQLIFMFFK